MTYSNQRDSRFSRRSQSALFSLMCGAVLIGAVALLTLSSPHSADTAFAFDEQADPKALQAADVTMEDLPLDEDARSAFDGRAIPGVLPRRETPPEIQARIDDLRDRRSVIAEGLDAGPRAVLLDELPTDRGAPNRMDSGVARPDELVSTLPLESGR